MIFDGRQRGPEWSQTLSEAPYRCGDHVAQDAEREEVGGLAQLHGCGGEQIIVVVDQRCVEDAVHRSAVGVVGGVGVATADVGLHGFLHHGACLAAVGKDVGVGRGEQTDEDKENGHASKESFLAAGGG